MEKEINIDEILDKYYQIEYNKTKGGQMFPMHYSEIYYTKQAIKEILTETLQMAADEARASIEYELPIGYVPQVDKESITSLINKIKF